MEELERRIAMLQRKIQRERMARESAEKQLETYSLETYRANQKQKKRARELHYLVESSAQIATDKSLTDLAACYLEITQDYTDSLFACYHLPFLDQNDKSITQTTGLTEQTERQLNQGWLAANTLHPVISEHLPLWDESANEQWLVCPISPSVTIEGYDIAWLLFLWFTTDDNQHGWFCFLNQDRYIDEDMLFVLNTSKEHIVNGIKRKQMERNIRERNTELQQAIEQLQLTQKQLVQSEKMAVLGQMSAGIAHEINNPISFVKSNVQVLKDYWQDIDQWINDTQEQVANGAVMDQKQLAASLDTLDYQFIKEDVEEMLVSTTDGIKRVAELVADLKTFTHPGNDGMQRGSITPVIESAAKIASKGIPSNIEIHTEFDTSLPVIAHHSSKLQQVFINLIVNAGQAMQPNGGSIWIRCKATNTNLIVEVEDTGCGMDQAVIDKLFTPFFTTKPVGDGTGLGLSISYAILDSHNASISVDSVVGQGTTFTIAFPFASSPLDESPLDTPSVGTSNADTS